MKTTVPSPSHQLHKGISHQILMHTGESVTIFGLKHALLFGGEAVGFYKLTSEIQIPGIMIIIYAAGLWLQFTNTEMFCILI